MKVAFPAFIVIFLFTCCQKKIDTSTDVIAVETISSNALAPLPCHSTSFSSDYPVNAGQIPPFRFTKTLYPDTRVRTINVLSRAYSVHPAYKKQAYEIIGTFTYATNQGTLTGTKELWEYYRSSTGAAAKRSISKKNISLTFYFNAQGYCHEVRDNVRGRAAVIVYYDVNNPHAVTNINVSPDEGTEDQKLYYPHNDEYGNTLWYDLPYNRWASSVRYSYDYTIPRNGKNYSFIPSQNLISQEYSLLECMQWLPQPTHQRKSVAAEFYPYTTTTYPFNTGEKVVQSQNYKNYTFDSKGNQTSLTYADNVLQKTTWFCK